MSGQVVTLFPKRTFTFTSLQSGGSIEVPIIKALDVSQYTEGTILVRCHSKTMSVSGSTVDVNAYVTAPSAEDPATEFVHNAGSTPRGTVQILAADSAPLMKIGSMTANFGGMLRITVKGTQGSGTGTFTVDLSAELALKA